jgi:hypothetical protein
MECSDEVRAYLDREIIGWRDDINSRKGMNRAVQIQKAREIVERYNLRGKELPRKLADRSHPDREQEYKDAQKLTKWKQTLKGNGNSKYNCPDEIRDYLDVEMPHWRDEVREKNCFPMQFAKDIVRRYHSRGGVLPRQKSDYRKTTTTTTTLASSPNGTTVTTVVSKTSSEESQQEYKDARKLHKWRQTLKGNGNGHNCSDEIRDFLDAEMVNWRETVKNRGGQAKKAGKGVPGAVIVVGSSDSNGNSSSSVNSNSNSVSVSSSDSSSDSVNSSNGVSNSSNGVSNSGGGRGGVVAITSCVSVDNCASGSRGCWSSVQDVVNNDEDEMEMELADNEDSSSSSTGAGDDDEEEAEAEGHTTQSDRSSNSTPDTQSSRSSSCDSVGGSGGSVMDSGGCHVTCSGNGFHGLPSVVVKCEKNEEDGDDDGVVCGKKRPRSVVYAADTADTPGTGTEADADADAKTEEEEEREEEGVSKVAKC